MVDYLSIAAWVRNHIETGQLPPGGRVPGSTELMRLFDVGERTARRALKELKSEGLIITERGRGTFARSSRPVQRLVFGEKAPGHPVRPTASHRETFLIEWPYVYNVSATADVAHALGIRPGSKVRACDSSDGTHRREIQFATSYRPLHLPDHIEPVRFRDELCVRLPKSPERGRMELTIAAPVIDIVRTSYAANDQPVEVTRIVMDANSFLLEYHHPATDGSAAHTRTRT
jgi:GntR family transcriptional regulator